MIDLAKIADMALILIDVSIGFEMETFEFISILRSHGFPNVMGVQTHMDYFKENKTLSKAKKRYKKRFEYEVGSDYKLFTIPGIQSDGLYPKRDVINLARYLSIIKYAQVPWKMNHPYIVPDRWENNDAGPQQIPDDKDVI
ncbi:P-loop containing nucleoside triphosphate hydrolase [Pseudocohnilembus persalinus]|uniref:p-loop containing nucleoside triphosphate hydrolase n=1 Tax=Pseudocohnilembus persalinus TaxID=266149 RepID=A0A0V0R8S4_PSEPJ|nr:P-loop containing nucleoside triphosphate hydrolase [Pseudocohnilembus persalinus]|eukprot:KRX10661.1 P-loop containing nucleoside triphosphate hydrolase [Pseudocohnilembus persalinus]